MAGNMNRRGRGGMMQRDNKPFNIPGNRIEFRFLIPSKAASIIIGKGGERIQRLRHECNARLSIPDNHGPERVFILESTMDNCIKVWHDCLPDLKDCMFPNTDQRKSSGSFRDDNPDMDLRFLVHDSQVGAIIGKGGINVKNLRMQYQLNVIKVFPVTAPNSSDRLVQMVGKFDKVFECFRVIYDTLESQSIKGKIENYNSENFDESLTASYGGWSTQYGGGSGGSGGAGSGSSSGASGDNMRKSGPPFFASNDRNPPQNPRFTNRTSEPFFQKPDINRNNNNNIPKQPMNRFDNFNDNYNDSSPSFEMEMDNFQMPSFTNRLPPMSQEQNAPGLRKRNFMDNEPDNNRRGGGGGGGRMKMSNPNTFENRIEKSSFDNRNQKPYNFDNRMEKPNFYDNRMDKINRMDNINAVGVSPKNSSIEKLLVSIPTSLINSVKGKNGEVLSNIISDSGAEISIDGDDEQNMETILSLTGTRDQIDGAQYLLQICIKKSVLNL